MTEHKQPGLLRDSLLQMQAGTLHCPDDHFLDQQSVPADILDADDEGHVWLALDKPPHCAEREAASFDIVLNCYKADLPFELDLLGAARMVTEKEEFDRLLPRTKGQNRREKILLAVEVIDVDYCKHKTPLFQGLKDICRTVFSHEGVEDGSAEHYADHHLSA